MTQASVALAASVDDAWPQFQELHTWEGVAGFENLCDETHDAEGNLRAFRFFIDTSLGRISVTANVSGAKPVMTVLGEEKGVAMTVSIVLREAEVGSIATIDASAEATSFMAKPFAKAINSLLAKGLESEAVKFAERVR